MRLRKPNIAKLREQRDEQGLLAALEDKDPAIREAAANALKRVAGPDAVEPLRAALLDESRSVRLAVVATLENMEATDPLVDALGDKDSRVRASAAKALAKIGDAAAVVPLTELLGDEDPKVRAGAIAALESFDDPRVVEALGGTVGDREESVRLAVTDALGRSGDQRAVEPLSSALRDREEPVRRTALSALEKLDAVDDRIWIGVLEDQNAPEEARLWAAEKLADRGTRDAVDALIRALDDYPVRFAASDGLEKVDDPRAGEALAEMRQEIRDAEMSRLKEELEDPEHPIRRVAAAEELAGMAKDGGDDVVEVLIRALDDEEGAVNKLALQGLRQIDDPRAIEAVKHDPAVGDRYQHERLIVGTDYDTSEHWKGTVIEASPPTKGSCMVRVRVEEATGSYAGLEGSVQEVDLGEFPNSANDHPDYREVKSRYGSTSYHRLDPSDGNPHYTYRSDE